MRFCTQNLPQPTLHGFIVTERCNKIPPSWQKFERRVSSNNMWYFLSNPQDASWNKHSCRVGWGTFCMRNRIRNRIKNRMCKRALRVNSVHTCRITPYSPTQVNQIFTPFTELRIWRNNCICRCCEGSRQKTLVLWFSAWFILHYEWFHPYSSSHCAHHTQCPHADCFSHIFFPQESSLLQPTLRQILKATLLR